MIPSDLLKSNIHEIPIDLLLQELGRRQRVLKGLKAQIREHKKWGDVEQLETRCERLKDEIALIQTELVRRNV